MTIRKECIGSKIYIKALGHQVEVIEENKDVLLKHGKTQFFKGKDELVPVKKEKAKDKASEPIQNDQLLQTLKEQAASDFEGRTPKEVKADFDLLSIEYPVRASRKALATIILE